MSMGLYTIPSVYQATWIEMKAAVTMSYEVDRLNENATLKFGTSDEYMLTIGIQNLNQLIELASAAQLDLTRCQAREG
ncbi:hypothetical protein [Actinophytocola sediminis]